MCAEPKPTDSRYLDILHKTYSRHQDFPRTQPKDVVSLCLLCLCVYSLPLVGSMAAEFELSSRVVTALQHAKQTRCFDDRYETSLCLLSFCRRKGWW